MASRGTLINLSDARRGQEDLLIEGALEVVEREPYLRPELFAGDYRLPRSLLRFDLLAGLVVSADAGGFDTGKVYPSFVYWSIYGVEPLLARLLRDGDVRAGLFPSGLGDVFLATVLRGLGRLADRRGNLWSDWGKAASDFLDKISRYRQVG